MTRISDKINVEPPQISMSNPKVGSSVTKRSSPPGWWALLQLAALSFHMPLALVTSTQATIASTRTALLIGAAVSLISFGLYGMISRLVASRWTALSLVSALIVVFWHWSSGDGLGVANNPLIAGISSLLIVLAAIKYAERHYLKILAFLAPVVYAATLTLLAAGNALAAPERTVDVQTSVTVKTLLETPDIIVIVLDGYGRSDVMKELYQFDNEPFLNDLRARDFQVAEEAVSNYSITHMSIPALFNMSYMHSDGAVIGNNDLAYLADQIAGDNDLVAFLKANGYLYIHGEANHWHNRCGPDVDLCLRGPTLDVTGQALLRRTPIGGLLYPQSHSSSTALNLMRIRQLTNWDETSGDWPSGARFVFLHLLLPHPPMFLDSTCNIRFAPEFDVHVLKDDQASADELRDRRQAWVEQVECTNTAVRSFVDQVNSDAVVVLVSDHGPDSYYSPGEIPSDDALHERFAVLTAARLPVRCDGAIPDDVDTVNLFRAILSCLAGQPVEALETRSFVAGFSGPIVEVSPFPQNPND